MHLSKGSEVEVTSDDDGFRGVWYVGKIVQPPRKSDDGFVQVEYNELVSEEDESKKLCERVHVSLVRPLPPDKVGEDDVFEVDDVVDVFHNDGWWVGVVEEVVGGDELKVLFDDPPDRLSVKRQDVRLHLDWVLGKWEKPQKKSKNKKENSSRLAMLSNHPGNSKRQNGSGKKQQAGISGASTEKKDACVNDEIVEKECNAEEVDMSVNALKGEPAKNCETPPKKEKKKNMDQDSSRPAMLSNHFRYARRQKTTKKQAGKSFTSTEKKDTSLNPEILETDHNAETVKEVNGVSAKNCKTPPKKDQKNKSMDQEMHTVDSTNGSTQGDVNSKRKRGKQIGKRSMGGIRSLRKRIMEESFVEDEAEMNAGGDSQMQTELKEKSNGNRFQPSSNDSMKATADKKHTSGIHRHSDSLSETTIVPFPEDQPNETVPSKRVKRPKNKLSNENEGMSKLVDKCQNASQGNTSPEINHVKNVHMLMDGNPGNVSGYEVSNTSLQVDEPSPTGSDASRTLRGESQRANANGKLDDFGATPVATHDKADNTDGLTLSSAPGDSTLNNFKQAVKNSELATSASARINNMENCQSLPFIKCSPLWKTIESMEIYKRIEQKPHFSPLLKMPEETREGLAIAHMVNFSNLVERITKLRFSDPITIIESIVGALAELESNGFDVEAIGACLTQLLSKKQTGEELHKECQDIENEISDTLNEREKIDEEINQLNQQMNELAAKLGDAVTRKEMKERVISTLKTKQDVASKDVQGLQLEFQNIVSSFP